jgi:putative FmdB family regulatory protein
MPIYEIRCRKCGTEAEILIARRGDPLRCPDCGSEETSKLMSATSSRTGKSGSLFPGPGDTACCGSTPAQASCAGPGSCCGRTKQGGA